MLKYERQDMLLDLLGAKKITHLGELAEKLKCAAITVRRDLEELSDKGIVTKIHGGAMLSKVAARDASVYDRLGKLAKLKNRIGRAAARLLEPGQIVFFDPGTTPLAVVDHIPDDLMLTVITTGLMTATALCSRPLVHVIFIGGDIHHSSLCTTGHIAAEQIADYYVDIAFLSTQGISYPDGSFEPYLPLVQLKRTITSVAKKIVLLVDHTKFGVHSLQLTIPLEKIDLIITDDQIEEKYIEEIKRTNTEIIVT